MQGEDLHFGVPDLTDNCSFETWKENTLETNLHLAKGDSQNTEMSISIRVNFCQQIQPRNEKPGNEKPAHLRANTKPD